MSAEMSFSYLSALPLLLTMAFAAWLYSRKIHNVNIVDSLWSLMFLAACSIYLLGVDEIGGRNLCILLLVALWAIRLSVHLTIRNWGKAEDHRYVTIRQRNEPGFANKSVYLVFGLQAMLAWIISMPLLFAVQPGNEFNGFDLIALLLCMTGILCQAIADYQLLHFSRNPANKGKVLDQGLWHYSRHPNYFGEFCLWWGFYLFALPEGALWALHAPLIMSVLLLKISGVRMMEEDMDKRRPAYAEYVKNTNAFIPGKKRRKASVLPGSECHE
jgi:steroid 5-alpha reductase family enzyme